MFSSSIKFWLLEVFRVSSNPPPGVAVAPPGVSTLNESYSSYIYATFLLRKFKVSEIRSFAFLCLFTFMSSLIVSSLVDEYLPNTLCLFLRCSVSSPSFRFLYLFVLISTNEPVLFNLKSLPPFSRYLRYPLPPCSGLMGSEFVPFVDL